MIETVVFDLGGVLVDWNPRYLYRQLSDDESKIEHFLEHVCNGHWNERQDAGRPFAVAVEELIQKHPEHELWIRSYHERWIEMLKGTIDGTVKILNEIHANGRHRLYALTNWSDETFPHALRRFEFLKLFETVLVSGREKLIKPDARFFNLLKTRHGVNFERAVFIDDVEKNVSAARELGFKTLRFTSPEELRRELAALGVL